MNVSLLGALRKQLQQMIKTETQSEQNLIPSPEAPSHTTSKSQMESRSAKHEPSQTMLVHDVESKLSVASDEDVTENEEEENGGDDAADLDPVNEAKYTIQQIGSDEVWHLYCMLILKSFTIPSLLFWTIQDQTWRDPLRLCLSHLY